MRTMSEQGIFELVWENGQFLTRGFHKRSQNGPSCNIDYSYNARLEDGGDTSPPQRQKFMMTSDSIVDDSHNNSFLQNDEQNEPPLLELYKNHFKGCFSEHDRGNINMSYDHKLLKDSQVVPVHETAPTGNTQAHQISLQQQHQVSNPLKRPRVHVLPNSKMLRDHQDLEPETKKETVNFSLFLRSPVVPTSTTPGFSRAEKLQNKPVLAPAGYGTKSVEGFQNQLNSMDVIAGLLPPGANNKSVSDVQSEAVNRQTSSLRANMVTGKLDAGKCKEPPVPSSSFCSFGASNNPTYNTSKRRYEDSEESACPSDNNEKKPERKAVPARSSKNNKKKPTPEVLNLSERRRRDKINKKMRALQELIPNCNKVDKASLLDEAIWYLKAIQFQVKMMSMGTGVCMPPMMLPTRTQQIMHAHQMSHFYPMGIGMGMRMQMGVNCNPAQFLIPHIARAAAVPGIFPETRIPIPGFPGQPLPTPVLRAPIGLTHRTVPVAGISRAVAASMELMDSASLTNPKDSVQNVKVHKKNVVGSKIHRSA